MSCYDKRPVETTAVLWRRKAEALRAAAQREGDEVARQTLLTLAEDCETLAAAQEAQQPGKPKPPGNPPQPPDGERPPPIEEPPQPMPPPRDPPPAPLSVRK